MESSFILVSDIELDVNKEVDIDVDGDADNDKHVGGVSARYKYMICRARNKNMSVDLVCDGHCRSPSVHHIPREALPEDPVRERHHAVCSHRLTCSLHHLEKGTVINIVNVFR